MAVNPHRNYKQYHVDLSTGVYAFVQWLTNEHADETGPGWEVVEAFDGTNRDTPTGDPTLANLPGSNLWQTGPLTSTGSWIVLRSLGGRVSAQFELYIEYASTTQWQYLMMPLDDFATGGGASSPPTFPATGFGTGLGTLVTFDPFGVAGAGNFWYGVADEGMVAVFTDGLNPSGMRWAYIGECDPVPGQEAVDDRPFILWDTPTAGIEDDQAFEVINRISPFDDVTFLTNGHTCHYKVDEETDSIFNRTATVAGHISSLGVEITAPVPVLFDTSGHPHMVGTMRNIRVGGGWITLRRTINDRKQLALRDFLTNGRDICIVVNWDGVRIVPSPV